jgi:hypothetical protein
MECDLTREDAAARSSLPRPVSGGRICSPQFSRQMRPVSIDGDGWEGAHLGGLGRLWERHPMGRGKCQVSRSAVVLQRKDAPAPDHYATVCGDCQKLRVVRRHAFNRLPIPRPHPYSSACAELVSL